MQDAEQEETKVPTDTILEIQDGIIDSTIFFNYIEKNMKKETKNDRN